MPGLLQPTDEFFKDGQWGWDGARWRKANMPFGFIGSYLETQSNLSSGAGTVNLDTTPVPEGWAHVITRVAFYFVSASINRCLPQVIVPPGLMPLGDYAAPTASTYYSFDTWCLLTEDDYMRARFYNCTAGDDLYIYIYGYRIQVV